MASIFRLFVLWGDGIKTKMVISISTSILPYGSGKASHTTSDETVMVKRNTATSEESKQLIGFPSVSGATNFLEIEVGNAVMNESRTIDQPWNSAQKSWRLSTLALSRTNSNDVTMNVIQVFFKSQPRIGSLFQQQKMNSEPDLDWFGKPGLGL